MDRLLPYFVVGLPIGFLLTAWSSVRIETPASWRGSRLAFVVVRAAAFPAWFLIGGGLLLWLGGDSLGVGVLAAGVAVLTAHYWADRRFDGGARRSALRGWLDVAVGKRH